MVAADVARHSWSWTPSEGAVTGALDGLYVSKRERVVKDKSKISGSSTPKSGVAFN